MRRNRWVRLAAEIDWDAFEKAYSEQFAPGGAVALPPACAGLPCDPAALRRHRPRGGVAGAGKPYLQYFLGFEKFSDSVPFSARTVARFRARIPDKAVRPAVRLLRSYR